MKNKPIHRSPAKPTALTKKQEDFCTKYVACHNPGAAAYMAGYSPLNAGKTGGRLIRLPHVKSQLILLLLLQYQDIVNKNPSAEMSPAAFKDMADYNITVPIPHRLGNETIILQIQRLKTISELTKQQQQTIAHYNTMHNTNAEVKDKISAFRQLAALASNTDPKSSLN